MVFISLNLIPDIVGSGVGGCRDGCGIRLCCFSCGAEGVLHLAAGGFACGHKLLRRAVIGQRLGFRCFRYNCCFFCNIGKGVGGRRRDLRIRARSHIPAPRLIGVIRLASDGRNLVCGQLQRIALIAGQRHSFVRCAVIVPFTFDHLECHGIGNRLVPLCPIFFIASICCADLCYCGSRQAGIIIPSAKRISLPCHIGGKGCARSVDVGLDVAGIDGSAIDIQRHREGELRGMGHIAANVRFGFPAQCRAVRFERFRGQIHRSV